MNSLRLYHLNETEEKHTEELILENANSFYIEGDKLEETDLIRHRIE